MNRFIDSAGAPLLFLLWMGVVILLVGFLIVLVGMDDGTGNFATNCTNAGGHIYQPDQTLFCLTDDGRMLEVYP